MADGMKVEREENLKLKEIEFWKVKNNSSWDRGLHSNGDERWVKK